ncbi:hypothetical protein HMPREF0080_01693, partial [Anaeroglobus geminatus F0357]
MEAAVFLREKPYYQYTFFNMRKYKENILIVFYIQFEESLRMRTNGTYFRSFFRFDDAAAVATDPGFLFGPLESGSCFYVAEERAVPFFVVFFDLA